MHWSPSFSLWFLAHSLSWFCWQATFVKNISHIVILIENMMFSFIEGPMEPFEPQLITLSVSLCIKIHVFLFLWFSRTENSVYFSYHAFYLICSSCKLSTPTIIQNASIKEVLNTRILATYHDGLDIIVMSNLEIGEQKEKSCHSHMCAWLNVHVSALVPPVPLFNYEIRVQTLQEM